MRYTSIIIGIVIVLLGGWLLTRSQGNTGAYCQSNAQLGSKKPIQSHRSYCLKTDASTKTFAPNSASSYTFSLIDDQGKTLKDFETVHEKIMHVIVVRKDLAHFQHVHPEYNQATGDFTLKNLTLPTDGPYRIFADFTPASSQMGAEGMKLPVTLSKDVWVGNVAQYTTQAMGEPENMKTFDGYTVTLSSTSNPIISGAKSELSFAVAKAGKPVTNLEQYLGALGHSVILSEGDLDFIHAHALSESTANQGGTVTFATTFPKAGKYKAFTQFQHSGKVITSDFVLEVAEGERPIDAPAVDHENMGH